MESLVFIAYQVVAIAVIIHVVMAGRQPAKTLAWALVVYFVPVVGMVAYAFFGATRRKERRVNRRRVATAGQLMQMGQAMNDGLTTGPGTAATDVAVLTDGYQFFGSLLRDIMRATSHIHIDIYIFSDDPLGRLVADALADRARSGVEVRIVYDDVGSWSTPAAFFERMRMDGIEVEPFMPVRFPRLARRANYRNHRKVIVIDGSVGYVGGMNIAMRYVKGPSATHPDRQWRDTMLRIEGQGVQSLQHTFLTDWYFVDQTLLTDSRYYPLTAGPSPLFTLTTGPTDDHPVIMQAYMRIILSARSYVYLQTPYFLPPEPILMAMQTAAMSGVDVRLMVPRHGDSRFIEWASRSSLREAAEAGIRVSLYEAGFLHSKLMVCDDSVATCGSTNIDFRSFENNFEANTFVCDADVARRIKQVYLDDETRSVDIVQLTDVMHPRFGARLTESLTHLLSPLL